MNRQVEQMAAPGPESSDDEFVPEEDETQPTLSWGPDLAGATNSTNWQGDRWNRQVEQMVALGPEITGSVFGPVADQVMANPSPTPALAITIPPAQERPFLENLSPPDLTQTYTGQQGRVADRLRGYDIVDAMGVSLDVTSVRPSEIQALIAAGVDPRDVWPYVQAGEAGRARLRGDAAWEFQNASTWTLMGEVPMQVAGGARDAVQSVFDIVQPEGGFVTGTNYDPILWNMAVGLPGQNFLGAAGDITAGIDRSGVTRSIFHLPEVAAPQTAAGALIRSSTQAAVGMVPAFRIARAAGLAKQIATSARLAGVSPGAAVAIGAAAEVELAAAAGGQLVFDPHDERIPNAIQQIPGLEFPLIDYLAELVARTSDPKANAAAGREVIDTLLATRSDVLS